MYSALRRAHRNSPEYRDTLKAAKYEYFIDSKKGKKLRRVHFQCAQCKERYSRKQVFVDHISPVIDPNTGKVDFNTYISRLFCGKLGLQILHKTCHDVKTKIENALRRKIKKEKENG